MTAPEERIDILVELYDEIVTYSGTQALYESDWISSSDVRRIAVAARSNSSTTVFQVQQAVANPADVTYTPGDALWVTLPAAVSVDSQGDSSLPFSSLEIPLACRYVRLIAWDPENSFATYVSMRAV